MNAESARARPAINSLAQAKRSALKVTALYVALVGTWILLQSGIPIAFFIDYQMEPLTWKQLLVGWFFILSTGWLLYLLMSRGLDLIAAGQEALKLRDRAIESSTNAIMITEFRPPDLPIIYVNPAFERVTGYSSAEALGRNPDFLQAADLDQPELGAMRLALKELRQCHVVLRSYRKDGTLYWNDMYIAPVRSDYGRVTHYVAVWNDITETRRYQEELARRANYDTLTALPNRNLLADRASTAIVRARRQGHGTALAFIDLDNFRVINDSLGYAVGDSLLRLVGERLRSSLREVDTVARTGGDEFVLVLGDQEDEKTISTQIQRVMEVFVKPYVVADREFFVTASVGIASYPGDGDKVEILLQNAEIAMYRAKDVGRNTFQFFTAEMNASVNERLVMESWLRRALERQELLLHYQPQVDLRSNAIFGAEALVRWQHPKMGLVPPGKFIPLAEQTGLIVAIGEWVLRTACAQNKAWQDAGLPPITVAVNISARQFREKNLVDSVAAIISETGLDPRYLELEVTEGVIMHDAEEVIAVLQRLKSLGVTLSIDDFGTGYSSLSYLKRFPVDRLKIDQSFIRDVATDSDGAAIARAVINLGHDLNLKVIAEGVETKEQLDFLRTYQCDEKQGYYFSRPVPAGELEKMLRERRTLDA
jgi:diguanylate cyclase (GGDEF)-like protein/PAS domain S-box-containing protein